MVNPEAIKHRTAVKNARAQYHAGLITLDQLHQVVDEYRTFMVERVGKKKAGRFTRAYILRAL